MNRILSIFVIFGTILLSGCNDEQKQAIEDVEAPQVEKSHVAVAPSLSIRTLENQNTITLTWTAQEGVTEYRLYWNTVGNVTKMDQSVVISKGLQYQHTAVETGTTYYYRISAINENGEESPLSVEASAKVDMLVTLADEAAI